MEIAGWTVPAPGDPDAVIAAATLLAAMAVMGLIAAWSDRRFSVVAVGMAVLGTLLFAWVATTDEAPLTPIRVPEAFIEMVARVVR